MERAPVGAAGLRRGDHACLVCDSDDERWRAALEFTRAGLARGERTLYVAWADGAEEARARLGVLSPLREDQMLVVPAAEAMGYAGGAPVDIPERDAAWRQQVSAATAAGFAGLSVTADMGWFDEVEAGVDEMCDYEQRCGRIVDELPAAALCVYDRRRFDDRALAHVGLAHPICRGRAAGSVGELVSGEMEIAAAGPGALRLSGEIDIGNVPSLITAMRVAADGRSALLLDLAGLEFVDVAGMRAIRDAALELALRGGELSVLSPRPSVERVIGLMGMEGLVGAVEAG